MARRIFSVPPSTFGFATGATLWTARTAGTQVTDLLNLLGAAVTTLTHGQDGGCTFSGPADGTGSVWLQRYDLGADTRRVRITAEDWPASDLSGTYALMDVTARAVSPTSHGMAAVGTAAVNRQAIIDTLVDAKSGGAPFVLPPGSFNTNPLNIDLWDGFRWGGAGSGVDDASRVTTRLVNAATDGSPLLTLGGPDGSKKWMITLEDLELVGNASSGDNLVIGEVSDVGTARAILGSVTLRRLVSRSGGAYGIRCQGKIDQLLFDTVASRYNLHGVMIDGGATYNYIAQTTILNSQANFNTDRGYLIQGECGMVNIIGSEFGSESRGLEYDAVGTNLNILGCSTENISTDMIILGANVLTNQSVNIDGLRALDNNAGAGVDQVVRIVGAATRVSLKRITAYLKKNNARICTEGTGSKVKYDQNRYSAASGSPTLYLRRMADGVTLTNNEPAPTQFDGASYNPVNSADRVFISADSLTGETSYTDVVANAKWALITLADGAIRHAFATVVVPSTWLTYHMDVWWAVTAVGSGDVVWKGTTVTIGDGELLTALNIDYGNVTATAPAQNVIKKTRLATGAIAAPDKPVSVRMYRMGTDAADNLTVDAVVLGVMLSRAT